MEAEDVLPLPTALVELLSSDSRRWAAAARADTSVLDRTERVRATPLVGVAVPVPERSPLLGVEARGCRDGDAFGESRLAAGGLFVVGVDMVSEYAW